MTDLLLATFNPGKTREIARLLGGRGFRVRSLGDAGIREAYEESGRSYEENAVGKARHYAALSGLVAISDDSGIEVEALGGRPGPMSARYGGEEADDAARCRLMLRDLDGVPEARRGARYVAVAAIARPDGLSRTFRGECSGRIASAPGGSGGFGYDPLFFYPAFAATFAEVSQERKDAVSHRGTAFRALAAFLPSEEGIDFLRGAPATGG